MMRESSSGAVKVESIDVVSDVASIAAVTAPDTALVVPNARVGDQVFIQPLGVWLANLGLPQGRCIVAGTVQMRIINPTAGALDPASQSYRVTLLHESPATEP